MFLTLSQGVPQPTVGGTLSLGLGGGEGMLSRCLQAARTHPHMHAHGHAHAPGMGLQDRCMRVQMCCRCPKHTRRGSRLCGRGEILDLMVLPQDGDLDGWLLAWRRSPPPRHP